MLISKIKRRVKLFILKNRSIKLNDHERHLNKKHVSFKLGNRSPETSYRIDGSIYSSSIAADKAAVFSIVYFDSKGRQVKPAEKLFGFSSSIRFGNYKYLPASAQGEDFTLFLTLPEGAVSLHIKIISIKKNVDIFLRPGASLRPIKIKHKKTTSSIIGKVESQLKSDRKITADSLAKILKPLESDRDKAFILQNCFEYFINVSVDAAHIFGRLAFREKPNLDLVSELRTFLTQHGRMYELKSFLDEAALNNDKGWNISSRRIADEIDKLENGFTFHGPESHPDYPVENSVLYLLHNSLPYNSGGYATRTHGLLQGIKADGRFVAHGVSRPGFPSDHKAHISSKLPSEIPSEDVIDDIRYLRCDQRTRKSSLTLSEYVENFSLQLEGFARENNVAVIHAASNYPNGLAAVQAARRLGIKSVYEVRGLWEITRMSRQSDWENTEQYKFTAKMEAEACMQADAVITITDALKDLMVSRGVDKNKIIVAPNCVHTDLFQPHDGKDIEISTRLGIAADDVVIGYVGSIVNYEGLDDLIKAVAMLRDKGVTKFKMLLIGDGAVLPHLKSIIEELKLEDIVICTGRVPHSEVPRYYSLIDITPFPRKPFLVCETVSPLKPFEALASGKATIVSSCAALTEIIEDNVNGLVFEKGNIEHFCTQLQRLILDADLRARLGAQGRIWVCQERDWSVVSRKVADLYARLTYLQQRNIQHTGSASVSDQQVS